MSTYAAVPSSSSSSGERNRQQNTVRILPHGSSVRAEIFLQLRRLRPGFVFVALAAVCSAFAGLGAKLLSVPPRITPVYALVFWRSLFIFIVATSTSKFYQKNANVLLGPPAVRPLIFARSIIGVIAISLFYLSVQTLNLGEAVVLSFLSPIFVGILGRLFLGEPWKMTEAASCFVSLLGVTVIARPEIFGLGAAKLPEPISDDSDSNPSHMNERMREAATAVIYLPLSRLSAGQGMPYFTAVVCSILSAFLASCVVIILRRLRGVKALHILVIFSWVALIFAILMTLVSGDGLSSLLESAPRDAYGIFTLFCCLSLATLGSQFFFVIAVRYENAATCSTLSFIQVPVAFFLEFLLRGVAPKITDALGGGLIFCSVLSLGIAHVRRERRERLLRAAADAQAGARGRQTSPQPVPEARLTAIDTEKANALSSISLSLSATSDNEGKMDTSRVGQRAILHSSSLEVDYAHQNVNEQNTGSPSRRIALSDSEEDLVPPSIAKNK